MEQEPILILAAKVAMLERLVRLLLFDRLTERDNPIEAAKALAAEMISSTEARMKTGPDSPAAMLAAENYRAFFDTLLHEVSQGPRPPGSTPNP